MPTYEMAMLIRVMHKVEVATTLKRVSHAIFNNGGFIRKIENLGENALPCKASAHGQTHWQAKQFIFYFDVPPKTIELLNDEYRRDMDVIRSHIFKTDKPEKKECTLETELLPPPYRADVQELMRLGRKRETRNKKFKYNSGLDYYPFQK